MEELNKNHETRASFGRIFLHCQRYEAEMEPHYTYIYIYIDTVYILYIGCDHSLAIDKGRHKKSWLPKEQRVCGHCMTGEVDTEMHFILHCNKYFLQRHHYLDEFNKCIANFKTLAQQEKLAIILGEDSSTCRLAAGFVASLHNVRDSIP